MKAKTINQFKILHFLNQKFYTGLLEITLADNDTVEVSDVNGVAVLFTTVKTYPEYVEVAEGIYCNEM